MSDQIEKLLSEMPLLSNLNGERISEIVRVSEKRSYKPNELIIREGDITSGFFLILDGQVEVQQRSRPLRRMGRGQFFGETALIQNESRSADVIAIQSTTCLKLTATYLKELIQVDPQIAIKLLEETVKRSHSITKVFSAEDKDHEKKAYAFQQEFDFKSDLSRAVFENLVDSFLDDYMVKKFVAEKCGWRSAIEISRATGISPSVLYGRHGKIGSALEEPIRRGVVETRYFPGERGRGGEVLRFRITYEKEPVKSYANEKVRTDRGNSKI